MLPDKSKPTALGPEALLVEAKEFRRRCYRLTAIGLVAVAVSVVASGCLERDEGAEDSSGSTTAVSVEASEAPEADTTTGAQQSGSEVALWPSGIAAKDQSGDGGSVVVDSVTLSAPGFVVVHREENGGPGETIAVSTLLEAGDHENLVVELSTPLTGSETILPMLHIDVDGSGIYEEVEPPGFQTDGGEMAIAAIKYKVE